MIAKTDFIFKHRLLKFALDTDDLARNYDDERYAYWIVESDGCVHEINIDKAPDNSFKSSGVVNTWFDKGSFEDSRNPNCVSDVTFTFSDESDIKLDISNHAYAEIKHKVTDKVGDDVAMEFILPAVMKALKHGSGSDREQILRGWLDCDSMRVCTHCGNIMEQGWYMCDAGYACSDECAAEMEGITMEQFRKWRIYKDDIIDYLEKEGGGRKIEDLTIEECNAIIDDYCEYCDYYYTEWY